MKSPDAECDHDSDALSGCFFVSQEKSNKEIDLTYKLKVLQQELEQEEASHKTTRALLADKSKIKVTIEGAKSESMKGKPPPPKKTRPFVIHVTHVENQPLPFRNGAEARGGASGQTPVREPNTGAGETQQHDGL